MKIVILAPHQDQHQTSGISQATFNLHLLKVLCWSLGGAVFIFAPQVQRADWRSG